MKKLNTSIFILDSVEVVDSAGPFEVFSRTRLVPSVESRRSGTLIPPSGDVLCVGTREGMVYAVRRP